MALPPVALPPAGGVMMCMGHVCSPQRGRDSSPAVCADSPSDFLAGRAALGSVATAGAAVYVKAAGAKDAKKGVYRFTVKDTTRELKLRSDNEADCTAWVQAVTSGAAACPPTLPQRARPAAEGRRGGSWSG